MKGPLMKPFCLTVKISQSRVKISQSPFTKRPPLKTNIPQKRHAKSNGWSICFETETYVSFKFV